MVSIYHITSVVTQWLYKTVLVCLSLALIVYVFQNGEPGNYARTVHDNPGQFLDCRVFKNFASLALSENRDKLYDYQVQKDWFAAQNPGTSEASYVPYPPAFALLWMPLSKLADSTCFLVWSILSIVSFSAGLFLLAKSLAIKPGILIWVLAGALASIPGWRCVALGQTSLFLGGFFAASLAFWLGNRSFIAACCFNMLALKPTLLFFPAALCWGKSQLKLLVFSISVFLGLLTLLVFLLGEKAVVSYPLALFNAMASPPASFHVDEMVNTKAMLFPLAGASLISAGILLAALVFSFCLFVRKDFTHRAGKLSFLSFATLAFGTHIHLYECTLLAVPALLLLGQAGPVFAKEEISSAGGGRFSELLLGSIKLLLVLYPAISWIVYLLFYRKSQLFFSIFAYLNIYFALAMAVVIWKSRAAKSA